VTLRDAHQCLWATRMTTAMMKDIAPRLDEAGSKPSTWLAVRCST
jgi:oxaloacetate decarboxylase (Na+ extruding) subunit alpha